MATVAMEPTLFPSIFNEAEIMAFRRLSKYEESAN